MVVFGGNTGAYMNDVWALTNLSDTPTSASETPRATASLGQNHPNPFNPSTTIGYTLPANAGRVTLRVYDVAGRVVRALVDAEQGSGAQSASWNGRDDRGNAVASGVYFYRLTANGVDLSRKMVVTK
jgi:flagellar hook assembly protein FlgD